MRRFSMRPSNFGCVTPFLLVSIVAACSDQGGPTQLNPAPASPSFQQTQNEVDGAEFGFTPGWFQGQTAQFFYHKPFFCRTPAADGNAVGSCPGSEVDSAATAA